MKITVVTAAVPKNMFRRWVPMVSREGEFGTNSGGVRKPTAMPSCQPHKRISCVHCNSELVGMYDVRVWCACVCACVGEWGVCVHARARECICECIYVCACVRM